MASLEEVFSMAASGPDYIHDDVQFLIDEDLRTIAIPPRGVVLGVTGDKDVNRVNFQMPLYYNGFDLSTFSIRVDFVNASGESGISSINDKTIEDNILYFTWLVDELPCRYVGNVTFAVRLIRTDAQGVIQKAFHTTINTAKVLEGLVVTDPITPEQATDLLERMRIEILDKASEEAAKVLEEVVAIGSEYPNSRNTRIRFLGSQEKEMLTPEDLAPVAEKVEQLDKDLDEAENRLSESIAEIEDAIFETSGDVTDATEYISDWVSGSWNNNSEATASTVKTYWRHKIPLIFKTAGTKISVDDSHVAVIAVCTGDGVIERPYLISYHLLGHGESYTLEVDGWIKTAIGTDGVTNISAFTSEQVNELKTAVTYSNVTKESKIPTKTSELTNDSGFITEVPVVDDIFINAKIMFAEQDNAHTMRMVKASAFPKHSDEEITVNIPNTTGSVVKNATVRLALHKGTRKGINRWDEVWSEYFDDNMQTVRPVDENGDNLTFDLSAFGNYDFVHDSAIAKIVLIDSIGRLYKVENNKVMYSDTNGNSWTNSNVDAVSLAFIDSNNRIFVVKSDVEIGVYTREFSYLFNPCVGDIFKYPNSGSEFTKFDYSPQRFCEDEHGNIILARYQYNPTTEGYGAMILRLAPSDTQFREVYYDAVRTHTHHVGYDSMRDIIYAGIDDSRDKPQMVRSLDHGATWETLPTKQRGCDQGWFFHHNGIAYGGGENNVLGGLTLLRSEDPSDITKWESKVNLNQMCRLYMAHENIIFACVSCGTYSRIEQRLISEDNGKTWRLASAEPIMKLALDKTEVGGGWTRLATPYTSPMGADEPHFILSGDNKSDGVRVYLGGNHHYGLMYVNVGDIPISGKTIKLKLDTVSTQGDRAKTFNAIEKPVFDASLTGKLCNSFGDTSHGLYDYPQINRWLSTEVNPVGRIPIDHLTDVTIVFDIGSLNQKTGKEYVILDSDGITLSVTDKTETSANQYVYLRSGTKTSNFGIMSMPPVTATEDGQMCQIGIVISADGSVSTWTCGRKVARTNKVSGTVAWADAGAFKTGAVSVGINNIKIWDRAFTDDEMIALYYGRNYHN